MSLPRKLSYSLAINEALHLLMEEDSSVMLIGQGVKSPWYVGNTAKGLLETFGEERVIDTPVSENAMTGAAVGAALVGMRPVVVHPRMDFMLYAFDPIINQASNWYYMNGGRNQVPVVFWGIVNRGGEQAAQHSQSLHSLFAHIPGLKVVMPATAEDAKGLMISSIRDPNPVVFVDDRWLYGREDIVPEGIYTVDIGKAAIRREGRDVTLVAFSCMVHEGMKAAEELAAKGVDVEVLDGRTASPLDRKAILSSVQKTGRLVVADSGWGTCGIAAEIGAIIAEECPQSLKAPVKRVVLPQCPAPAARTLEAAYFPTASNILRAIDEVMRF